VQAAYNEEHGIEPRSIVKSVDQIRFSTSVADARGPAPAAVREAGERYEDLEPAELIRVLETEMREAAEALDFERAARLRDELFDVKASMEGGERRARRSRISAIRRAGGDGSG